MVEFAGQARAQGEHEEDRGETEDRDKHSAHSGIRAKRVAATGTTELT